MANVLFVIALTLPAAISPQTSGGSIFSSGTFRPPLQGIDWSSFAIPEIQIPQNIGPISSASYANTHHEGHNQFQSPQDQPQISSSFLHYLSSQPTSFPTPEYVSFVSPTTPKPTWKDLLMLQGQLPVESQMNNFHPYLNEHEIAALSQTEGDQALDGGTFKKGNREDEKFLFYTTDGHLVPGQSYHYYDTDGAGGIFPQEKDYMYAFESATTSSDMLGGLGSKIRKLLDIPDDATFQLFLRIAIPFGDVLSKPNLSLVGDFRLAVTIQLPDDLSDLKQIRKRRSAIFRQDRRAVYDLLSDFVAQLGYGERCLERSICEAAGGTGTGRGDDDASPLTHYGLLGEILALLLAPGYAGDDDQGDDWDLASYLEAEKHGVRNGTCSERYGGDACSVSLQQLLYQGLMNAATII